MAALLRRSADAGGALPVGNGADDPVMLWPVRKDNEEALSRELREQARKRLEQEYQDARRRLC